MNNEPCGDEDGCDPNLPKMLGEGTTLTVYGPADFCKVYRGEPDG